MLEDDVRSIREIKAWQKRVAFWNSPFGRRCTRAENFIERHAWKILGVIFLGVTYFGAYHHGAGTFSCGKNEPLVYEKLDEGDMALLDGMRGNYKLVQEYINGKICNIKELEGKVNECKIDAGVCTDTETLEDKVDAGIESKVSCDETDGKVKYLYDKEQFVGNACKNPKHCDIWVSASHFIRVEKGDCDDVLAFAHLLLRNGVGLYLGYPDESKEGHAVYIYKGDNDKYGIISINKSEQTEPIFDTIEDAAYKFSNTKYNHYKIIDLPDDEETLLYRFNIKPYSDIGKKHYFKK